MSLPRWIDISSFASTGIGARQDECLSEDGQARDGSEIERAGLRCCRAQEQLGLLGDLWSLFCASPRQGFFVIQVVCPSASETGTAKWGSSRLSTVNPGESTRQRVRAVPEATTGSRRCSQPRAQSHPLGFAASAALHNPIQLWVPQKPWATPLHGLDGPLSEGTRWGSGIDTAFIQVRNSVQPNKEYNFFSWCTLICPVFHTQKKNACNSCQTASPHLLL